MLETFKDCLLKEAELPPSKLTGNSIEDSLSLRRLEILHIIRDHKFVSMDFIQRRFMTVSGRLLRYDLKKLRDLHLIKKRGTTNGVIYEAI
jgi:RIO-like serine/threonine protein kinase